MAGKFDPDAVYWKYATGFEKIQLKFMAITIQTKSAELRELREERATLQRRVQARGMARERALRGGFNRG